eukprot:scaffold33582_cov119-Skeletonema_dohrnii-CCMP3373.AAC.3
MQPTDHHHHTLHIHHLNRRQTSHTRESIKASLIRRVTDLEAESFAIKADLMDGDMAHKAKHLAASMREHSTNVSDLMRLNLGRLRPLF